MGYWDISRKSLNQRGGNTWDNGEAMYEQRETKRKEHWNIVVMYAYMNGCMIDMDVICSMRTPRTHCRTVLIYVYR